MDNNERAKTTAPRLWGKLRKNDDGVVEEWLSLVEHSTDVASVFRTLCRQNAISRSLRRAVGRPLAEIEIERLGLISFLHDIGKCNHGFQAKAGPEPRRVAGHVREVGVLILDPELQHKLLEVLDFTRLQSWFEDREGALRMLLASVSHHGKPIELDRTEIHRQKGLWLPANGVDPLADVGTLMAAAQDVFPSAFESTPSRLPSPPALQHRFAGLVMLADWLGSHAEGFFPYQHKRASRLEFAADQAEHAVTAVGLNVSEARRRLNADAASFEDLFPGYSPTPLQTALFNAPDSPVLIAEAETGSGKTEAALAHFFRLFARGEVDSLYFALPTRVAARELYERVLGFVERAFGTNAPPVVLAVPGYVRVDGQRFLPPVTHLWQDDATDCRRERAWSAEQPKRFLAAPVAVGTIDQALLAVMQVKHAHLRAVSLERALLVVDEAHASDTYMRGLLRTVLEHHRNAGGRALLLSATLGSDARAEFLAPRDQVPITPSLNQAVTAPYPSISDANGAMTAVGDRAVRDKNVSLEPADCIATPETLLPQIVAAVSRGARVLVVLNTVARVVAFLRAAEGNPQLTSALFRVRGVVCPHHGRFARADRLLLDQAVSAAMGKHCPPGPLLLVGSQTLEQSLDIDADWLVTDLCPMDVLLQRIGRLRRHDRKRPGGFKTARCTVLTPQDPTLESWFKPKGVVRGEAGLGKIYPDLRVARLTLERIGAGCTIRIPADNRALVEAATHSENLSRFDSGPWVQHRNKLLALDMAHSQAARHALIQDTLEFGDNDLCFRQSDEKLGKRLGTLGTRLGLNDRRLPLETPLLSPLGQQLNELPVPGWMAGDADGAAPDAPPESDAETITFRYGGKAYRYTRLGLELDDERQSPAR